MPTACLSMRVQAPLETSSSNPATFVSVTYYLVLCSRCRTSGRDSDTEKLRCSSTDDTSPIERHQTDRITTLISPVKSTRGFELDPEAVHSLRIVEPESFEFTIASLVSLRVSSRLLSEQRMRSRPREECARPAATQSSRSAGRAGTCVACGGGAQQPPCQISEGFAPST